MSQVERSQIDPTHVDPATVLTGAGIALAIGAAIIIAGLTSLNWALT